MKKWLQHSLVQSKQHYTMSIRPLRGGKCSLLFIILIDLYLILPEEYIHEGYDFVANAFIDHLVN